MEKYLPCYEKSYCERTEKNIVCEINLAEYLPNAAKVIRVSAAAVCDECEVLKDSVNARGVVKFSVVYLSDFKDRLRCAAGECELSHTFPAKGIMEALGDSGSVYCTCVVSEERGQVLSPRKLSVSCKAVVSVQAVTVKRTEIFDTDDSKDVHKLCGSTEYLYRHKLQRCETVLEESIALEDGMPEIREIISSECGISSCSAVCRDGRIYYSGTVCVSCLYLGGNDDGEEYISFSKELEFSADMDSEGMADGCFIVPGAVVTGINADAVQNNYGEMSVCSVNIGICISATAFGICEAEVLRDAFCTSHDCECEVKSIAYDCFVCGTNEKASVTENVRANLGSITDIVSKNVSVSVLSTELSGKVPVYNMRAALRLMGTNEQGGLECVSTSFAFKVVSEHELSSVPDRYRSEAEAFASECECRIENGEIACSLTLEICSCIYARSSTNAVTAMVIDETAEVYRDKSEYILYYPCGDDSVWSCAKKYRVSPKALLSVNGMGLSDTDFGDRRVVVIPSSDI